MSSPWEPNPGTNPPSTPPPAPPQPPVAPGSTPAPPPTPPAPPGPPTVPGAPAGPPNVPPTAPPPGDVGAGGGSGGGRTAKIAVAVIGAIVLIGGAAFAATQIGGSDGPGSPEAAVEELIDAANAEDVLGVLGALDPGEASGVTDHARQFADELERLGVLDENFDLGGIDGVDLELEDLEFETQEVEGRDDLVRVYVDGDFTSETDPDDFPMGELVDDLVERFDGSLGEATEETSPLGDDVFLVARDTGADGWRVSVGYTIAEQARAELGNPDLEDPIEPIGSDSPEEAIEDFLAELAAGDPQEMVARLAPSEVGALHEYGPTLGGDDAFHEFTEDVGFTVADIELDVDENGDRATASIRSIEFDVAIDDEQSMTFTYEDSCVTFDPALVDDFRAGVEESIGFPGGIGETPLDDGEFCIGEIDDVVNTAFETLAGFFGGGPPGGFPEVPDFDQLDIPDPRVQLVREDDGWFIAPVATWADNQVASVEGIDRDFIEDVADFFEEIAALFSGF